MRRVRWCAVLRTLVAIPLAASALPALPATDLDVTGWENAKWSMTEEQVLAAFPNAAKRLDPPNTISGTTASVGITGIELAARPYNVLFGFDAGKLKLVRVAPPDNLKQGVSHTAHFRSLDDLLTQKYGKPTSQDDDPNALEREWRFPTGTITLSYLRSGGNSDILLLFFKASSKPSGSG